MKTILSVILTATLISASVSATPVHKKEIGLHSAWPTVSLANIFGRINAHRQQNGVSLNWTVINPQYVSSFIIERSWDGEYFEVIDEVQVSDGINRYRDNDIYPGYLYYRITAVMTDGTENISPVEMVRIVRHG